MISISTLAQIYTQVGMPFHFSSGSQVCEIVVKIVDNQNCLLQNAWFFSAQI